MRLAPRLTSIGLLLLAGCPATPTTDAGTDAAIDDDAGTDAPAVLRAEAGPSQRAALDADVVLDASASTGAVEYEWWPGDGRRLPRQSDPVVHVSYAEPGRYRADLIVYDAAGNRRTDTTTVTVTRPRVFTPRQTSTVTVPEYREDLGGQGFVVTVVPDDGSLALAALTNEPGIDPTRGVFHVDVCDHPRTVATFGPASVVVACEDDEVVVYGLGTEDVRRLALPYGSRPYGALALGDDRAAISLAGTGEVALVEDLGSGPVVTATWPAIEDARAMALLPDGRVVVSRWRSPDTGGELVVLDVDNGARTPVTLAVDPQISSDTEIGGVPSYLGSLDVSPDGTLLVVGGLQTSLDEGVFRSGRPLRFETALRATISFVDVATLTERFERRRQLDNRGFLSAVTFSYEGDFVFLAARGNRTIERYDVLRDVMAGTLQDVGFALDGLATNRHFLYVDASLSRALVELDVDGLDHFEETVRAPTVDVEPLAPEILRGARLFADAADGRLGRDGYMACAHCHLDGLDDHRTWDFTDRGEGLRNTIELVGRAGEAPIHWSANFDEIQDFENDIRNAFLGAGLLTDGDWAGHMATLGPSKAGLSEDLDALAAYVASLDAFLRSPHREDDGSLGDAATRGRVIFERSEVGCTTCHAGTRLTDSTFVTPGVPLLHDVGTLGAGSGMRLGEPLTGLDTPTLRGVFATAPYLHDGSAATLREVVTTRNATDLHGTTSTLSPTEIDDLVAYLECLDATVDP